MPRGRASEQRKRVLHQYQPCWQHQSERLERKRLVELELQSLWRCFRHRECLSWWSWIQLGKLVVEELDSWTMLAEPGSLLEEEEEELGSWRLLEELGSLLVEETQHKLVVEEEQRKLVVEEEQHKLVVVVEEEALECWLEPGSDRLQSGRLEHRLEHRM
jgi:hypothetical protein